MIISKRLARLASLAAQRRYIVHATSSDYYIPSELLNDADNIIRQIRMMPGVRDSLPNAAIQAILDLEGLLDAAARAVQHATSNEELVECDPAWRAVREHVVRCLSAMDFNLRHWEKTEGLDDAAESER